MSFSEGKINSESIVKNFKALGSNQLWLLVTAVCVIFSIILAYRGIFEVSFLFVGDKYSSFDICDMLVKMSSFSSEADREMMDIICNVMQAAPILMGISVAVMGVPIVLGKKYKSVYIVPVILSTLYHILCQSVFCLVMAYAADEMSFEFGVTFVGILFFVETLATFILSIKLFMGIKSLSKGDSKK